MEEKVKSREEVIEFLRFGIKATNINDAYSVGLRNGMRLAISCLNNEKPEFEGVNEDAWKQTYEQSYVWKLISPAKIYECPVCGQTVMTNDICAYRYCHGCGAKMNGAKGIQ